MSKAAAKRGAKLLDFTIKHWFLLVDERFLEQRLIGNCVIGQLFCGFDRGLTALGIPFDKWDYYGFDVAVTKKVEAYDKLTVAWKAEVVKRKKKYYERCN